jgi:hypothetical protein
VFGWPEQAWKGERMTTNPAVLYSFLLYVLYILLPLIPAVLIFRLFPDTKVSVSGPLQGLTLNTTGAFGAYVVTAALGFFLVRNVESQIQWTRTYAIQGVIVDLAKNQAVDSDKFYSRYTSESVDADGKFASRNYSFVVLLDDPSEQSETVLLKYWQLDATGGTGEPPAPKSIPLKLAATKNSSPQRFRLQVQDNQPSVVPVM